MTKAQENILASLKGQLKGRRWLPLSVLKSYDGRSLRGLIQTGAIQVDLEYGVRV